jgi:3-oxoacyl-[acyl-carrier protein] reductase
MSNLKGKVAVVTGAARGIGKEIVVQLAKKGADIAIIDLNSEEANRAAKFIEEIGSKVKVYIADISNNQAAKETVDKVSNELGGPDILINNAGITRDSLILRMKFSDWESVISTNLTGAFNCLQAAAKYMMKKRWGRIINMSSVVGVKGNIGQANYSSAKAGLIGLTLSASKELSSRNITVNAIAPGYIETEMTKALPEERKKMIVERIPMGRLGDPEDIAYLVSFLCSDKASYITGQTIAVDGGIVL